MSSDIAPEAVSYKCRKCKELLNRVSMVRRYPQGIEKLGFHKTGLAIVLEVAEDRHEVVDRFEQNKSVRDEVSLRFLERRYTFAEQPLENKPNKFKIWILKAFKPPNVRVARTTSLDSQHLSPILKHPISHRNTSVIGLGSGSQAMKGNR